MRLAFYKGKYGTWWDKLIIWWSFLTSWGRKGKYSHAELIFSDGIAFSSSPREGGTRFKIIDFNDGRWDFIDIDATPQQEKQVRDWCCQQEGLDYDYFAIFGYIFGYFIGWMLGCKNCLQDSEKWYCTEISSQPLKAFNIVPYKDSRMDPDDMYKETLECLSKMKLA